MLTPAELTLLAEEIRELAVPGRVDKIHQPAPDRIVLRLAREGEERSLLIVARRGFARAHFVEEAPPNPRTPPPFCEELRRLLVPGRLADASTLPGDAVLLLDFEVRTDAGRVEPRRLVAELFGTRPNLLVVGKDGTILAVLEPREGARELLVGAKYAAPERPAKELAPKPPFSWTAGFSRPDSARTRTSHIEPAKAGGPEAGGPEAGAPLSRLIDDAVTPRETAAIVGEARDALLAALAEEEKKLRRRRENIGKDLRGAEEVPRLRAEGELLKANLSSLKRGMKSFDATSWQGEREETVRIALDPKRTPKEEVAHRFDEARRLERLKDAAAERLAEVDDRLAALAGFAVLARVAGTEDGIAAIRGDAGLAPRVRAAPGKKAAPPTPEPRKPYRTFVSKDGIEMLVGRTAKDNDELTFRIANGNDFWFHVRDYPGSHVVIRAREELPQETLLDAATLAVHFSRGQAGGKRDVSWTRRKYVTKAPKAPAGQVLLSSHKTIHLRPDPERLARLLKP
jgi:predicted ribosome quality control (RQC) complex YloA/Tae2 family protein